MNARLSYPEKARDKGIGQACFHISGRWSNSSPSDSRRIGGQGGPLAPKEKTPTPFCSFLPRPLPFWNHSFPSPASLLMLPSMSHLLDFLSSLSQQGFLGVNQGIKTKYQFPLAKWIGRWREASGFQALSLGMLFFQVGLVSCQ